MAKQKKKQSIGKNIQDSAKPVVVKSAAQTQPSQIKENPVMTLLFGHSSLDKKTS